jgi:serine protease AprX
MRRSRGLGDVYKRQDVSSIISAINWIQEINGYGRRIQIHGVNLSVGYPFDAEWFACGQSQLCVEVNRLVRSGVSVVVAAGNRGYGQLASTQQEENRMGGLALSISDPGNAELAITVGSTHRDMPHVYGVSYFSGKGPTGDGRPKPDLLAPGEKILSCATGKLLEDNQPCDPKAKLPNYIEYSGTSMAAPHVSGCIASFLSVKREFIGRPDRVKEVFLATATDLGRERSFQGAGLVDLMRAIQNV